ncbi:MAG: diacylglycerol kinase family protein, partial [Clostridia bacterium]|nr:diacylglycerol kinase family protein [Clostridia bacterium]
VPFLINHYIKDLPSVAVNGKKSKFINGVGFGIDGYCCEVGDQVKSESKLPNYTAIAIKGLLFHFKPVTATVVVDGKETVFEKVWIAPTMFGRYYGGGMMPTPAQDRNTSDKTVSLMVFHGSGKLKTLSIFPSIFKGEHIKKEKYVTILQGKNIKVTFNRPASLQIDGETVLNVTNYHVSV